MKERLSIPLAVFAGGVCGSVFRWALLSSLEGEDGSLVVGLLVVNSVGAFALGWLVARGRGSGSFGAGAMAFVATGVVGSFTTFSSYAAAGVGLAFDSSPLGAIAFLGGSVVIGLGAAVAGRMVARR